MAVNVIDDSLTSKPRARHTDAIDNLRLSVRLSACVLVSLALSLYLSPPRTLSLCHYFTVESELRMVWQIAYSLVTLDC